MDKEYIELQRQARESAGLDLSDLPSVEQEDKEFTEQVTKQKKALSLAKLQQLEKARQSRGAKAALSKNPSELNSVDRDYIDQHLQELRDQKAKQHLELLNKQLEELKAQRAKNEIEVARSKREKDLIKKTTQKVVYAFQESNLAQHKALTQLIDETIGNYLAPITERVLEQQKKIKRLTKDGGARISKNTVGSGSEKLQEPERRISFADSYTDAGGDDGAGNKSLGTNAVFDSTGNTSRAAPQPPTVRWFK